MSRSIWLVVPFVVALGGCSDKTEVPAPKTPQVPKISANPEPEHVVHMGGIDIQSSPAGLTVKVDGKEVGKTPVTVDKVKPGMHEVTFIDPTNGDVTMGVEVAEGQYPVLRHNVVPRATDEAPKKKDE